MGFLCRELNSGLDLERVISYHWTTQEGCSFERYIIGLFRSTVLRVMSPTRFLCATMIGVSLGGFDPPPLDSLVCDHYTTNGWFRSTSSNPPVCDHTLQRRVLICAPPSHISVIDFTMSRLTTSIWLFTLWEFIIINSINRLNDFLPNRVYNHYSDICPTFAHIHRL